jgi:hypothetical protein
MTIPGYKKMRVYHLCAAIIGEPDAPIEAGEIIGAETEDGDPNLL